MLLDIKWPKEYVIVGVLPINKHFGPNEAFWNLRAKYCLIKYIYCNQVLLYSNETNHKPGPPHSGHKVIKRAKMSYTRTRQIWEIWKLRPAYSPETPNLGQKRWCFVPCDLEIWWMPLENNRASLLCCFKLCATFHSHRWIQTGVTVRKRPIWVKFDDF